MSRPRIRCAIYTRKSTDEGLDQAFNSLDAQGEACAAYIASQRNEGWRALPDRYDDGGISGGTLERPALKRLLTEIDAGRVDMVVVYKIDRLTRSLADFAKLVERLDASGCSFVSVTQSFNTATSMGRLTLNMLLSFAQFEREVTAERIRDKVAASKKKGLWMGGLAPLGYDPHPDRTRRELVVNEGEAEIVRQLFALYADHGSLSAVEKEAGQRGLLSKHRVFGNGKTRGGDRFSRGQIHKILTNPVYRGLTRHKEKTWPGKHQAIIDDALWERVQTRLQAASAKRRGAKAGAPVDASAPLKGKVRDETGDLLTPTHTQRHGRRLRYYVSNRLIAKGTDPRAWRLPAPALEAAIAKAIADHLADRAKRHAVLARPDAVIASEASQRARTFAEKITATGIGAAARLIATCEIEPARIRIRLDGVALAAALGAHPDEFDPGLLAIDAPFACRRRGVETRIVAGDRQPTPDQALIRALQNAHRWASEMRAGVARKELAQTHGVSASYVGRAIPLAGLSPRIQQAIIDGDQPMSLTLESVIRSKIPLDWDAQERLFGFAENCASPFA